MGVMQNIFMITLMFDVKITYVSLGLGSFCICMFGFWQLDVLLIKLEINFTTLQKHSIYFCIFLIMWF